MKTQQVSLPPPILFNFFRNFQLCKINTSVVTPFLSITLIRAPFGEHQNHNERVSAHICQHREKQTNDSIHLALLALHHFQCCSLKTSAEIKSQDVKTRV